MDSSIDNMLYQFSWYRGKDIYSNMNEDIGIYYCTGANYRAFKINRNIIGDTTLDYREDYSFLKGGYGIYFLYSVDETSRGSRLHIYVGKAEGRVNPRGMDRLVEHIKNDEKAGLKYANKWNKALYITIKEDKQDPEFTSGVIKALESAFIAMFKGLEQRIALDGKNAKMELVCYNIRTNEQSNEPLSRYKTHIHAIIALLSHSGIRILPEGYIGAFEAESKIEENKAYKVEIENLKNELDSKRKELEKERTRNLEQQSDEISKAVLTQQIITGFKSAQELYSSKSALVINGRIFTASDLITNATSKTVITPSTIASSMVKTIPCIEDSVLNFCSKDGVFVKSLIDRVVDDNIANNPAGKLSNFIRKQLFIVVPTTECYNLTMKEVMKHYIEKLQRLDPMWAFDVSNCVLPNIILIHNLETLIKTVDGRNFIRDRLEKEFGTVKFDVVIGNPPYNNDIYLDFVTLADRLSSKYTCMITPAKWQAKTDGKPKGSKTEDKNETFRKNIVPRMSDIVFYTDTHEIFDIAEWGGISYFLIDKDTHLSKNIRAICSKNSALASETEEHDEINPILLPRKILQIIGKVGQLGEGFKQSLYVKNTDHGEPCLMGQLGFKRQIFTGEQDRGESKPSETDYVEVMQGEKVVGYRQIRDLFTTLNLDKWKCISSIMPGAVSAFDVNGKVLGMFKIVGIGPYQVPKGSFPVLHYFDSKAECDSFISYMNTKLISFLYYLGCCGTTLTREFFRFVPDPGNFNHIFTDKELYDKYNLTPEEIAIIESVIKERK